MARAPQRGPAPSRSLPAGISGRPIISAGTGASARQASGATYGGSGFVQQRGLEGRLDADGAERGSAREPSYRVQYVTGRGTSESDRIPADMVRSSTRPATSSPVIPVQS